MDTVQTATHNDTAAAPTPDAFDELEAMMPPPSAALVEHAPAEPTVQILHGQEEEAAEWGALKKACPLWGVHSAAKLTPGILTAMALRRRSAGDQLVIDLLAWAPIFRNAAEVKKGKEIEAKSGYGRSRLCLGVRMLEAVEDNGGVIPTSWLGLGPDGVFALLKGPKKAKAPKVEPAKAADTPDVKAAAVRVKDLVDQLGEPTVRDALAADAKAARALANAAFTAAIRAICALEPAAAKRALGKLAKDASLIRDHGIRTMAKGAKGIDLAKFLPEGGSAIDLFGEDEEAEQAPEHPAPTSA